MTNLESLITGTSESITFNDRLLSSLVNLKTLNMSRDDFLIMNQFEKKYGHEFQILDYLPNLEFIELHNYQFLPHDTLQKRYPHVRFRWYHENAKRDYKGHVRHDYVRGYYEGEFAADDENCNTINAYHGRGVYVYPSGASVVRYEGEFKNNLKHGRGILYYANGGRYEFVNGKKQDSNAIYYFPKLPGSKEASRYEGEYTNDMKWGKGKYIFSDGGRYEGDVRKGSLDGYGNYLYSSGDRYEGNFKSDLAVGFGVYTYKSGVRYEGDFIDDASQGRGKYIYLNGDQFVANFKDEEVIDNSGVLYCANGDRFEGEFKCKDKGEGVIYYFPEDKQVEDENKSKKNEEIEMKVEIVKKGRRGISFNADGTRLEGVFVNHEIVAKDQNI
jgi:hypothetical protein